MTVPVFAAVPVPDGDQFTLDGPEGHHAASVRRLRNGERLDVTDGLGTVAECVVVAARRDALDCQVLARRTWPAPTPSLVVVQALAKGDRGELAVELLTEVGVDVVVPWSAHRSVVRWEGERGQKARRRWAATAAEAAKQSRRVHWPVVAELASTAAVTSRLSAAAVALVLHEAADVPLASRLGGLVTDDHFGTGGKQLGEIVVVVGPEGGFTTVETDTFAAAGGELVRLGPTVLRTSTAGVVAATLVLAAVGRLGVTTTPATSRVDG